MKAFRMSALALLMPLLGDAAISRHEYSGDAMGATFRIVLYSSEEQHAKTVAANAIEEARRLDRMLSNYMGGSEWSRINQRAANAPVTVSHEMFELLRECLQYSSDTEGACDVTVGPLMKLWGFYKGTGHVPRASEVQAALKVVGYRNIVLDARMQTVRFLTPGVEMDPGGIGKGYAVERMAGIVKTAGISGALISAGGSTIYALGAPPGTRGWPVRIHDPRYPLGKEEQLVLKDASLSTSGATEKFFRADGVNYSHIMDPRTGYPARGMLSVSVVAPRSIDSEAWTKAVFVNGRQWTINHVPAGFRVFMCEESAVTTGGWLGESRGATRP
jgi:thiamine biosynthesis lipoprotein